MQDKFSRILYFGTRWLSRISSVVSPRKQRCNVILCKNKALERVRETHKQKSLKTSFVSSVFIILPLLTDSHTPISDLSFHATRLFLFFRENWARVTWRSWWFSNAWDQGRIRDGNDFIIVWLRRFRSAEFLWREIQISLAFGTKSPLHSPISRFWVSKQFSAARKSLIKKSSFSRFSFPWWGLLSEFEPDMKRNEGRTRNFGRKGQEKSLLKSHFDKCFQIGEEFRRTGNKWGKCTSTKNGSVFCYFYCRFNLQILSFLSLT